MEISTITITISVVILLLAIVSPLCNPFFRLPKKKKEDNAAEEETAATPISVVIIAHDNAPELKKHLTAYLTQDYTADYEIIVVADKNDPETEDVIKLFGKNKNLYATFLPTSSYYISRRKLAITVGMKAAHNDWVIVTDAWCAPDSDKWIENIAKECRNDKDIILGYTHYEDNASTHCHYEHLRNTMYNMRCALNSDSYGTCSPLIAMRKELFLKEDGFVGNLQYARGEYDFMVNKFGTKYNSSIAINEEAASTELLPVKKLWINKHLHHIAYRKDMKGRCSMSALYNFDMLMMHLCNIAIIAGLVYAILALDYIVLAAAIAAFIIEYTLRAVVASRAIKMFGAQISSFIVPLYDFIQPLHDIMWKIRYAFADKYDFITHKV